MLAQGGGEIGHAHGLAGVARFRQRDPDWHYALELIDLVHQFPPSRSSLEQSLKEIGSLPLRGEYDRVFLYRCLANRFSARPEIIRKPEQIKLVAQEAKDRGVPIRIGVNGGSLDPALYDKYGGRVTPEAMVESALQELAYFAEVDFHDVKFSVKASNVPLMIEAYRQLADATFHAGTAPGVVSEFVDEANRFGLALLEHPDQSQVLGRDVETGPDPQPLERLSQRLDRHLQIVEQFQSPVLVVDTDGLVVRSLDEPFASFEGHDIGLIRRRTVKPWQKNLAAALVRILTDEPFAEAQQFGGFACPAVRFL